MFYQAQINENSVVVSVIETIEPVNGNNIISLEFYNVSVLGKKWNGTSFEEILPDPIAILTISKLDFLRRFTAEERIAIRSSIDPVIIDFLYLLDLAQEVNLTDSDTIAGVTYCESINLLAEGRATQILTPEVQ